MAGKRIDIMDLKQLITLKKQGVSNRKAAQLLQLSRNTVNGYVHLFEGLPLETMEDGANRMSNEDGRNANAERTRIDRV